MSPREEHPVDYEVRQQIVYETVSKAFVWFLGITQSLMVAGIGWGAMTIITSDRRIYILEDAQVRIEKRQDRSDQRDDGQDGWIRSLERAAGSR